MLFRNKSIPNRDLLRFPDSMLNSKLKFSAHIATLGGKFNFALYEIHCLRNSINTNSLKLLYFAYLKLDGEHNVVL